jgi:hypothetical protein
MRPRAEFFVDFHAWRNPEAEASHDKAWWAEHRGVEILRL